MSERLSEETAHRIKHHGVWMPGCLTCQGYEMAVQTNLLDAIHSTLEASMGGSTIVNNEDPAEIHNNVAALHSTNEAEAQTTIRRLEGEVKQMGLQNSQQRRTITSLIEQVRGEGNSRRDLERETERLRREKAEQERTIKSLERKVTEEKRRADGNWDELVKWSEFYGALRRDLRAEVSKLHGYNPAYRREVRVTLNEIDWILTAADEREQGLQEPDYATIKMLPGWRDSGPEGWRKEADILRYGRPDAAAAAALCDALADALEARKPKDRS